MNADASTSHTDTKTRILDAAERVFSHDGFDAASLRTITTAANVNLAAVNYHFHSKEALFCAVVERRVRPINQRRLDLLEAIPGTPTPEAILDAFLRPPFEIAANMAGIIRPLMARLHSVPSELYLRIIEDNFVPLMSRFIDALEVALPGASRQELQLRMMFVVGAMTHSMAWGPIISKLSTGQGDVPDAEGMATRLVEFFAAGLNGSSATAPRVAVSKRVNSK